MDDNKPQSVEEVEGWDKVPDELKAKIKGGEPLTQEEVALVEGHVGTVETIKVQPRFVYFGVPRAAIEKFYSEKPLIDDQGNEYHQLGMDGDTVLSLIRKYFEMTGRQIDVIEPENNDEVPLEGQQTIYDQLSN